MSRNHTMNRVFRVLGLILLPAGLVLAVGLLAGCGDDDHHRRRIHYSSYDYPRPVVVHRAPPPVVVHRPPVVIHQAPVVVHRPPVVIHRPCPAPVVVHPPHGGRPSGHYPRR